MNAETFNFAEEENAESSMNADVADLAKMTEEMVSNFV